MERKKLLVLGVSVSLVLLLAVSLLVGACAKPAPAPEKTLQIGGLMGLTGFFTVNDTPDWNEAVIAADVMNEQGGITVNGQAYKVELVVEDIKSAMDGTTAAANRLVYDKGMKFIIGPCAYFASAAAPVTNPAQVMYISTWCCQTPGEVDATTPYAFTTSHGSLPSAIAAMKFMKQAYPEVKKVALVSPDDGAIPYLIPIVKNSLAAEGFTVVGDVIPYPNEMQDFSPIVAKILSLEGIDGVFQANGLGPHVGAIVKGLREAGFDKPYAASMPTPVSEFIAIAGLSAVEDVFSVCLIPNDPDNPPMVQEIIDRTLAQYGEGYSLKFMSANALWVYKNIIEAADSLDPTVVKAKFESMDKVDTLFGKGTICGDETYGIKHHFVAHPLPIDWVQNGQIIPGGWIDVGFLP
jgi:branched-chain amino acid transport system substrate-binding protein